MLRTVALNAGSVAGGFGVPPGSITRNGARRPLSAFASTSRNPPMPSITGPAAMALANTASWVGSSRIASLSGFGMSPAVRSHSSGDCRSGSGKIISMPSAAGPPARTFDTS